MKHQTDSQLTHYINKYGCFFMCICYWIKWQISKVEPSYDFLNKTWEDAIAKGIISGDMNKDGDLDDGNEALILDKNKLLELAGIPLTCLGSFGPHDPIPSNMHVIGEFYNDKTKFTHFVALDNEKKAVYDPILNSRTYREGILRTVRLFA